MGWTQLAVLADLPPGNLIEVERGEDRYALCNVDGEIRALWGTCPHHGGPLGEGALNGNLVACPWHMWEFHSGSGVCTMNESLRIPTFPVKIEGGAVMVDIA